MAEYSKNERAGKLMGFRSTRGVILDIPAELEYRCPVCKNEPCNEKRGTFDERLDWSEYNSFLWCSVCNRDYPSTLCLEDPIKATEIFLKSVEDSVLQARQAALEEAAQIAFETEKQAEFDGANLSGESAAFSAGMEHAANMIQVQINARISVVGTHASQQPHATDAESTRG